MNTAHAQAGISYWGVLGLMAIAALGLQFGVTAGQAYLDDLTINKTIEERIRANAQDAGLFEEKFLSSVQSQLEMNNVRNLKADEIMTVEGQGKDLVVHKNYEVRKHFLGNMDLIIHYERIFDAANPAGKDVDKPSEPPNAAKRS